MTDTKPSRFVITCQEVGCSEHIFYTKDDTEVNLYCWKHRSREGRHAAVRHLKPQTQIGVTVTEEPNKSKPRYVILKCINRKCNQRKAVPKSEWKGQPTSYNCLECGKKMLYHKDLGEGK